jgi:hypothetical protein
MEASESSMRSSFVTLTYRDEELPPGGGLRKVHVQNYLQRLRDSSMGKVRYFAVGEYGEKTKRPHYHLGLFNVDPFEFEAVISDKWPYGHVKTGEITAASAAYCAGYCFKKMGEKTVVPGQPDEFQLASKAPPLGAAAVRRIEEYMYSRHGAAVVEKLGDVPNHYRLQGKMYPLGKYWVNWLRDRVFLGEYKPVGLPAMYYEVNLDEETKRARAELRRDAQAKHAKLFRRRNANPRTL